MPRSGRNVFVVTFCLLLVGTLVLAGCGQQSGPAEQSQTQAPALPQENESTKAIVDMAGRTVTLPQEINKVVTLGPVPVLNGIVFTMGEGDKLINGLPDRFGRSPRWKYQQVFAPQLEGQPEMQGAGHEPEIEVILQNEPDVIITMNKQAVDPLEQRGLNVVFLSWQEPEDVKKAIMTLGEVFNKQERAQEYIQFWDDILHKVEKAVSQIPDEQRTKVLYCDIVKLTQPHLIAEWWIEAAGGKSVSNDGRQQETMQFSLEQLLQWQPEVIIVTNFDQIEEALQEQRLASIPAIKNNRLYVAPTGAHLWANRTAEQPLTVLWAAKTIYPELFEDLDLEAEAKGFYKHFFGYELADEQLAEMLSGKL